MSVDDSGDWPQPVSRPTCTASHRTCWPGICVAAAPTTHWECGLPTHWGWVTPHARVVLSRAERLEPADPMLILRHVHGAWRPRLEVARLRNVALESIADLPGFLWHADEAPRLADLWSAHVPGADGLAPADRVAAMVAAGDTVGAWRTAGIGLTPTDGSSSTMVKAHLSGLKPPAWIGAEVRRLAARYHVADVAWNPWVVISTEDPTALSARWINGHAEKQALTIAPLLRHGLNTGLARIRRGRPTPDDLHPLIHAALFADRVQTPPPVATSLFHPVRVRCEGVWHVVQVRDGDLTVPHTDAELDRERALEALGGIMTGCAAARNAWHTGKGRLPRQLRVQRDEFFAHAIAGDTDGVIRLLDAGFDPLVRDRCGRSLLHYLSFLDFPRLLPRLRAAGLVGDEPDAFRFTPTMYARRHGVTGLHEALVSHDALVSGDVTPRAAR